MIRLFIDEQSTKTNGYYSLRDSIEVEFTQGVNNLKLASAHEAIFQGRIRTEVTLCDSAKCALVRASDLLANALYHKYNCDSRTDAINRHLTTVFLPSFETFSSECDAEPKPAARSRSR